MGDGPAAEPKQVSGAEARVGCGVLVVMLLVAGLLFLFVKGLSSAFPDDPTFAAPGEQTRQLPAGTYAVYVALSGWSGDGDLPVRIRVTGPGGRAVALARDVRAPDLREPAEGGESYRDHGRFTVPAEATYTVAISGGDGRRALVTAPRSQWQQWGPVLLAVGAILGVFAVLIIAARLAARGRRPTLDPSGDGQA